MAHITKEDTKAIREALKETFPNTKFSVTKTSGNLGVKVTIKESDTYDLSGIFTDVSFSRGGENLAYLIDSELLAGRLEKIENTESMVFRPSTRAFSHFNLAEYTGFAKWAKENPMNVEQDFDRLNMVRVSLNPDLVYLINMVREICKIAPISAGLRDKWVDNSDITTDYFDISYYIDVEIYNRNEVTDWDSAEILENEFFNTGEISDWLGYRNELRLEHFIYDGETYESAEELLGFVTDTRLHDLDSAEPFRNRS